MFVNNPLLDLRVVVYTPTPSMNAQEMRAICDSLGDTTEYHTVNIAGISSQLKLQEEIEDFWRGTVTNRYREDLEMKITRNILFVVMYIPALFILMFKKPTQHIFS
jgi:hypothetical protein